jgi:uncharacterized protein YukJ
MPLKAYGVLKGRAVETSQQANMGHLEVHIKAAGQDYRIAVNVKSMATPPELRYFIDNHFKHPDTALLESLDEGITAIAYGNEIGVDYIRDNYFDYRAMNLAPYLTRKDNEFADILGLYIEKAIHTEGSFVYAFGEIWGPDKPDPYFGFTPGQGIHDTHMNQGNGGRWAKDNGTNQDGAMVIYLPPDETQKPTWIAVFTAFQSQTFQTDGQGNPIPNPNLEDQDAVRIVSAVVNGKKHKSGVTLLNRSARAVDISGWYLTFGKKHRQDFKDCRLESGAFLEVPVGDKAAFRQEGGVISLFDAQGVKIHGVSYTTPDYSLVDCSTVF